MLRCYNRGISQGMTGLAEQADWPLPQAVTPVVLRPAPDSGRVGGGHRASP